MGVSAKKPFVFITLGSYGDVLPMLSIAQQLSDNGERVVFLSNGYFKHLFESIDIEFIQLSSSQEYEHLISTVNVNSTYDLTVALVKYLLLEPVDFVLKCLENISSEGDIVLIANGTNLGARLYHDKTGCDFVSAYFAPCVLPSSQFFPRLFRYNFVKLLPFSKAFWCLSHQQEVLYEYSIY